MKELFPVGCVIMASGLSRRFGSNKLLADFCGEPVLCRAFSATDTPQLAARIVVTRSAEVQSLCRQHEVPVLLHSLPGRNDTVRLGLSHLLEQRPDLAGCMFLPGDQPLLSQQRGSGNCGLPGGRVKRSRAEDFPSRCPNRRKRSFPCRKPRSLWKQFLSRAACSARGQGRQCSVAEVS